MPKIKDLLQKLYTVEDCIREISSLNKGLKDLTTNVAAIDKELHSVKNYVAVILSNVKEIFAEQFNPFKTYVEEQLKMLSYSLSKQSKTLKILKEQAAKAEEEYLASAFLIP